DDEAGEDCSTVHGIHSEELPASIRELTDDGRKEGAGPAARGMQAPLARLRIVEPQREKLDTSGRAAYVELDEVGPAAPYFPDHRSPFILGPPGRPGQGL